MNARDRKTYLKRLNALRERGHRNSQSVDVVLRPSDRLLKLIAQFDTLNAAACEWGLASPTLERFVNGRHGISGNTVAKILVKTGLRYDEAFVHVKGV